MVRFIVASLILLALFCCNDPARLTENEKLKISDEVRETLKRCNDDIRQNGLSSELKYLDTSEHFFWVPPGYSSAISRDSVITAMKHNASLFKSIDQPFDTITIFPLTRDMVCYTGRIHSTMTDTSGKVFESWLWETALMIRRVDGWKLLSGQTSMISK
jgi:hypothetical protein